MNYSFAVVIGNHDETIRGHGGGVPTYPVIDGEPDRRRIRIGLAMLAVVVVVSLAMTMVVQVPALKLLMLCIGLFTVARSFSFVRALKRAR